MQSEKAPKKISKAAAGKPKKVEALDTAPGNHHHATAPKSVKPPTVSQKKTVSQQDIAELAHSYWVARGHAHGSHEEDWLRAERELSGK